MKIKVIFSIFVLGLIITCLSVKAEDLSKCKTMFDGKCYEYYDTNNSITDKKCKTMQNGVCTEYFDNSFQSATFINTKANCGNYFGIAFNNNSTSHIVTDILEGSSAAKRGMSIGNKLIKINGEKIKGYETGNAIHNKLNMFTSVNLEYKDNNGQKREVVLNKTQVCIPVKQKDELFETYWKQIFPKQIDLEKVIKINNALLTTRNYNYGSKQFIEKELEEYNYWYNKQQKFLAGYKICKYSNNIENINSCLALLVDRELQQISKEQEYARQQEILQAQQQMQQQQVNAMNNYSNALRNQHVQVDANVYHRGTVNVNSNVNVNGTYNHYFW